MAFKAFWVSKNLTIVKNTLNPSSKDLKMPKILKTKKTQKQKNLNRKAITFDTLKIIRQKLKNTMGKK